MISEIRRLIVTEDALDLRRGDNRDNTNGTIQTAQFLHINQRWQFETNPNKVKRFREWLRREMESTLAGDPLIERYIEEGYKKGVERSYTDVEKDKFLSRSNKFHHAKRQFLSTHFSQRATTDKVKLLASRTFSDLDGINQQMGAKMSRILADGLVKGLSKEEIASQLVNEVKLTQNRANAIVQTEITRAHAEGQLDAMQALGVTEVGAAVEWDTANDNRVCPMCKPLDGIVLKIEEARGMLPRHPHCRCAWLPAKLATRFNRRSPDTRKLPGQKRGKREVERAIAKSQKEENKKTPNLPSTDWTPAKGIGTRNVLARIDAITQAMVDFDKWVSKQQEQEIDGGI